MFYFHHNMQYSAYHDYAPWIYCTTILWSNTKQKNWKHKENIYSQGNDAKCRESLKNLTLYSRTGGLTSRFLKACLLEDEAGANPIWSSLEFAGAAKLLLTARRSIRATPDRRTLFSIVLLVDVANAAATVVILLVWVSSTKNGLSSVSFPLIEFSSATNGWNSRSLETGPFEYYPCLCMNASK